MGRFKFITTPIDGLWVVEPHLFTDERGYFMETYNQMDFARAGCTEIFVQDNQSRSVKGVLRGLHFQKTRPQGKLVRVLSGEVFDVAVDLRRASPSLGKWYGLVLSGDNQKQFYIPPGFAHGFLVLTDEAVFTYKCTDFYHPEDESGLIWNDPSIGIAWPLDQVKEPTLSEKDRNWGTWDQWMIDNRERQT